MGSVPDGLSALLTSKVDRLSLEQQIILKVASVIGQNFSVEMLEQILSDEAQPNLRRDLMVIFEQTIF